MYILHTFNFDFLVAGQSGYVTKIWVLNCLLGLPSQLVTFVGWSFSFYCTSSSVSNSQASAATKEAKKCRHLMQRPGKVKSRSERFNHKLTDLSDQTKLHFKRPKRGPVCVPVTPTKSTQRNLINPRKSPKLDDTRARTLTFAGEIERVTPQTDPSCNISSGQTLTEL